MIFRLASSEDIKIITSLRMQMLSELLDDVPEHLSEKVENYFNKHINDNTCICALLEIDNEIAAKAVLCRYEAMPDEKNASGQYARLFSVYTVPKFRRHGYMAQLLTFLLEKAKQNGIEEILASAEKLAIPLYQRLGFIISDNEMSLKLM